MIELGDEVKHTVSGFQGIAAGITVWLHGCRRINVQPKVTKEGTLPDMQAFDELEMEIVKKGVVKATAARSPEEKEQPKPRKKATGGPRPMGGKY